MKKFTKIQHLNEKLADIFKDKIREEYKGLKNGVLDLIEKNIEKEHDIINIQNFISEYLQNPDNNMIEFTDSHDVFSFYLKHQNDIDELLNSKNYYDKKPKDENVFSLYDYMINGTKKSVEYIMEIFKDELF